MLARLRLTPADASAESSHLHPMTGATATPRKDSPGRQRRGRVRWHNVSLRRGGACRQMSEETLADAVAPSLGGLADIAAP